MAPAVSTEVEEAEYEDEDNGARRLEWFRQQRLSPSGSVPAGYHLRAWQRIRPAPGRQPQCSPTSLNEPSLGIQTLAADTATVPTNTALQWTNIGPRPAQSGAQTISGIVTALAIDQNDPNIVYAGAGHGGIWKTTDGGISWTVLTDGMPDLRVGALTLDPTDSKIVYWGTGDNEFRLGSGVFKSVDGGVTWTYLGLAGRGPINKVLVHPTTPRIVYAATETGLYRSQDAGATWSSVLAFTAYFPVMVMHPSAPETLYVALRNQGVYRTRDGGATWTLLSNGIETSSLSTPQIALARSDSSVVYVASDDTLYRSANGGDSWTATPSPTVSYGTFGVDPTDANRVWLGGVSLYTSRDGGATWQFVSSGMHVDYRSLAFAPGVMYIGNDGGIWKSTDHGTTWSNLNATLTITEFYAIGLDPQQSAMVYGGTQDNGTLYTTGAQPWRSLTGGDGGYVVVDPTDSRTVYTEYQFGTHFRCTVGVSEFSCTYINSGIQEQGAWVAPVAISPFDAHTLFTATTYVYKSTNRGDVWTRVSPLLSGQVTGLALDPQDANTLYAVVGPYNTQQGGNIYRTRDGGAAWANIRPAALPDRWATRLVVDPTQPSSLYVTFSGFGTGHVFKSLDRGATWTNLTANLPDLPVNALLVSPLDRTQLILGTDFGVFVTRDGGIVWEQSAGVPNVVVNDLSVTSDGFLVAGTYGRGAFRARLVNLNDATTPTDPRPITTDPNDQRRPVIAGGRVVWEDNRHGNWELYGCQLAADGTCPQEVRLTNDAAIDRAPALSGTRLVWQRNAGTTADVYTCALTGPSGSCVSTVRVATNAEQAGGPTIDGGLVVWTSLRSGNTDLFACPLAADGTCPGEIQLTSDPAIQRAPALWGRQVVWEDTRHGPPALYTCVLDAAARCDAEVRLTFDPAAHQRPAITGSRIVWRTPRGPHLELYTCLYSAASQTCPVERVAILPALRRFVDPGSLALSGTQCALGLRHAAATTGIVAIDLASHANTMLEQVVVPGDAGAPVALDFDDPRLVWEQRDPDADQWDIYTVRTTEP